MACNNPSRWCVFHYSVALMTPLWSVLHDGSSWPSPFLKQLGDVLQVLLLVTLDHDVTVTREVKVDDDRDHRKLTRWFVYQHSRTDCLEWVLYHCQNRQHDIVGSSVQKAEVHRRAWWQIRWRDHSVVRTPAPASPTLLSAVSRGPKGCPTSGTKMLAALLGPWKVFLVPSASPSVNKLKK